MNARKVALVGNPNAGKSSLFNRLTGMNQHVGNYPGVTVDKYFGSYSTKEGQAIEVIDLPGTYSLFPKSSDEEIVSDVLLDHQHPDYPQVAVVVADASNLERSLLLFTQVADLQMPVVLALNMSDMLAREGLELNVDKLSEMLGHVPVVPVNARNGDGIAQLKKVMENGVPAKLPAFLEDSAIEHVLNHEGVSEKEQIEDTETRYKRIRQILQFCLKKKAPTQSQRARTRKIDRVLTHPVGGYVIFLFVLFLIFQVVYKLADMPMTLIDGLFANLSAWTIQALPAGVLTDLVAQGIIPGIGGVVIFIPQIALLFAFLAFLEETGYMSRVVFLMDKLMRPFGLHGKSVVPLISGVACAIPAIMATRGIDQWKDRLVTIMVVPLMSCSARLPVYALLIALVVPNELVWGVINLQGLTLMAMYLLGLVAALLAAAVFKVIVKAKRKSFLIMEMPMYRRPRLQNVGLILIEKTRVFVWEAGRIILAISIILWVLASYGPPGRIEEARTQAVEMGLSEEEQASIQLENSWIGLVGKGIEPAIRPLGFDWQIGIALITSFAAREVFVGSMATIYSVGEDFESGDTLLQRMQQEKRPDGTNVYNLASGLALMVFYAFAMQCMSTLAVTRRETKSWKWPVIQLTYMTTMAYVGAFITYQLLK